MKFKNQNQFFGAKIQTRHFLIQFPPTKMKIFCSIGKFRKFNKLIFLESDDTHFVKD